jgi:hypothetical protein
MRIPLSIAVVISIAAGMTAFVTRASEHAHEHGVGTLNIAIEKQDVEIELMLPGSDVVGFEHPPSSDEDRRAVEAAVGKLKSVTHLFSISSAAGCHIEEVEVHAEQLGAADAGHHDEADAKSGHDTSHDGSGATPNHAEFMAHYHFHCENPDDLTHIDVMVFEVFPSALELEAQIITERGQNAMELTPAASRLNL